jgi:hypothetical protein
VAGTVEGIADTTSPLELGAYQGGATSLLVGRVYRAQVRNNVLDDGTGIVFDADFSAKAVGANTFVESSTNAATVTINGALARDGDGRVSITASTPGSAATVSKSTHGVSADYLVIQDSTATGGAVWYAGANSVNVSNNTGWIFTSPNLGTRASTTTLAMAGVPFVSRAGSQASAATASFPGASAVRASGLMAATAASAASGGASLAVPGVTAQAAAQALPGTPQITVTGTRGTSASAAAAGVVTVHSVGAMASTTTVAMSGPAQVSVFGVMGSTTATAWAGVGRSVGDVEVTATIGAASLAWRFTPAPQSWSMTGAGTPWRMTARLPSGQ